jgi:hypothetical protein
MPPFKKKNKKESHNTLCVPARYRGEKSIMDALKNVMLAFTGIAFFKTPHVTLRLVGCLVV